MSQKQIWDFYQSEGIDSFDGSKYRLRALLEMAQELPVSDSRLILNIGTGNGWLERSAAQLGWKALSIDPSEVAIAHVSNYSIPGAVGLIEKIPFNRESIDTVFCSEVLEHLEDAQLVQGLHEIYRILKHGTYLIGSVPYNENLASGRTVCPECGTVFHRWGHHQTFTRQRMQQLLLDTGFRHPELLVRSFPAIELNSIPNFVKREIASLAGRFGFASMFPSLVFIAQKD